LIEKDKELDLLKKKTSGLD